MDYIVFLNIFLYLRCPALNKAVRGAPPLQQMERQASHFDEHLKL